MSYPSYPASISSAGEVLYDAVTPLAYDDANQGWALRYYCGAAGLLIGDVYDWAMETDDYEGWSTIMDVDRAPEDALPWLGQFAGVRLISGLTEEQKRDWIRETEGFKRGTVGAITGAITPLLTGQQTVIFRERYNPNDPTVDSAYHLMINTYTSETPDDAAVLLALQRQKPAGIILHYEVVDGQDYQSLLDNHPLYSDVKGDYANYQSVRDNTP